MQPLAAPLLLDARLQFCHAFALVRALVLKTDSARSRRAGIALVTLATFCFAVLDASAKWLVQSLPVVEVVWLRFVTHFALMTGLNFWALHYLQLAETGAIQFSVPILIALLSAWWLHERLDAGPGWRWWRALRVCCS